MNNTNSLNGMLREGAVDVAIQKGDRVQAPNQKADYMFPFGTENVQEFVRQGDDLLIMLDDGQTIIIYDFYANANGSALIFASSNGGVIIPWGLIAGVGLASAAALSVLEGGDGATPVRIEATVNDPATIKGISSLTPDKTVTVTGTGQPGETVQVVVGGKTETTVIKTNGTWSTNFTGDKFPGEGKFEAVVTVTDGNGVKVVLDGPGFVINLTPPAVSATEGTVSVGDVENLAEYKDGVTVKGEGEAGDKIDVTVGEGTNLHTQSTTVKADGTWEVTFTQTEIKDGAYTIPVKITATDPMGNQTVLNDKIAISTVPHPLSFNDVTDNNVINHSEAAGKVTVTGTSTPGAMVTLTIEGSTLSYTVETDSSGKWSVEYPEGTFATSDGTRNFTATTVDAAGNPTETKHSMVVDTAPNSLSFNDVTDDNVINHNEAAGKVIVTGTSTPGAMVTLTMAGSTLSKTVQTDSSGKWSVEYAEGTFATSDGTRNFTATTVDAAGNPSSSTHSMVVDTTTTVTFSVGNLTDDNIINADEANAGVTLTGTAEAGSASVSVKWNGVTLPVDTLNADGTWSVKFPTSAVQATGTTTAIVTAVDKYGNTDTDTRDITVDRSTTVAVNPGQAGGDNIITSTEANNGVTLTGTAEAGAKVKVVFQGAKHTVFASDDGNWSALFTSDEIDRGTYSDGANNKVTVKATDKAGNVATTTHMLGVDTEVLPFTAKTDTYNDIKKDGVLNEAEAQKGLLVTGTVEEGATSVMVQLGSGTPHPAVISGTTWSYTFPTVEIPGGDTTVQLKATATDKYGNVSAPYTETIDIDRIVTPFSRSGGTLGGDGTLNANEVAAGLNLSGVGEANSYVTVTLLTAHPESVTVLVDNNGTWNVNFASSQLPHGDGQMDVVFAATDAAGNYTSFTETVKFDTIAPDAPNLTGASTTPGLNSTLYSVRLTETIDDSFSFYHVKSDGSQSHITPSVIPAFPNTADFSGNPVGQGEYLVINHADTAGNSGATLVLTNTNGVNSTVDLHNSAFHNFDFTSVDLTFAKATMSVSAQDVIAMTGPDNVLTIKGDGGDYVTLVNATAATDQHSAPAGYTLYSLDHQAWVYLEDGISHPPFI